MANVKTEHVDIDYTFERVPETNRKGFWSMFMIMLGFTFFSASMWTGVTLANGLDYSGFLAAVLLGGAILSAYCGTLGYIGAKTGLNFDLLCHRAFGEKGSYLPSLMIGLTQIGWCGVGLAMFAYPMREVFFPNGGTGTLWVMIIIIGLCIMASAYFGVKGLEVVSWISVPLIAILGIYAMSISLTKGGGIEAVFAKSVGGLTIPAGMAMVIGSFVSGGTSTPNFVRFSKVKPAVITTVIAFMIGNTLMFFFGGVAGAFTGKNDIFYVMAELGLMIPAIIVLGANIWTTNDNGLYTGALGFSNIFKIKKRPMVLIAGIISIVAADWLYNNFVSWLNILNATLPPIGAIIMIDYFRHTKDYMEDNFKKENIKWHSVVGVLAGAVVGNTLNFGVKAINAMVAAIIVYFIGEVMLGKKKA